MYKLWNGLAPANYRFTTRTDNIAGWNGGSDVSTSFQLYSATLGYGQATLPGERGLEGSFSVSPAAASWRD